MPIPMSKVKRNSGRKPSCSCGQCSLCKNRIRVTRWRAARGKELEEIKDAVAREIGLAKRLEELEIARGESGE